MFSAAVFVIFLLPVICHGQTNCPDQAYSCPDDTTCCLLSGGNYGCCPFPNAVCCTDQLHCCPQRTQCNLEQQTCDSIDGMEQFQWGAVTEADQTDEEGNDAVRWSSKFPARVFDPESESDDGIVCKDGQSTCPDGTTCCQLASGTYGCCPMPDAVCCSDQIHCCPSGTQCNVEEGKCEKGLKSAILRWAQDFLPPLKKPTIFAQVDCGDGRSQCPANTTCCQLPTGNYGCCPMTDAVCCDDQIHCCPKSTTCDTSAGTCRAEDDEVVSAWLLKIPSIDIQSPHSVLLNTCEDDNTACPVGMSCCLVDGDSKYGCCPFPDGTCCSDKRHCCPTGSSCNILRHTCDQPTGETSRWFSPESGWPVPNEEEDEERIDESVACGNGINGCPKRTKCCPARHGQYRCCPFRTGVCCRRGHCCPSGMKCAGNSCAPRHTFNFLEFIREMADRAQRNQD